MRKTEMKPVLDWRIRAINDDDSASEKKISDEDIEQFVEESEFADVLDIIERGAFFKKEGRKSFLLEYRINRPVYNDEEGAFDQIPTRCVAYIDTIINVGKNVFILTGRDYPVLSSDLMFVLSGGTMKVY